MLADILHIRYEHHTHHTNTIHTTKYIRREWVRGLFCRPPGGEGERPIPAAACSLARRICGPPSFLTYFTTKLLRSLTPRPPTSEINKYLRSNHPIEASAAAERTGEPENRTEGKGRERKRREQRRREGKRKGSREGREGGD